MHRGKASGECPSPLYPAKTFNFSTFQLFNFSTFQHVENFSTVELLNFYFLFLLYVYTS